jgi:hypothetical protein
MKTLKKITIYLIIICFGAVQTSCLGSFRLTNVTHQWNQTIGSKWVNEILFVLFIPVYSITIFIDAFILNSIEFWSDGPGYGLKEGEQKRITSKDGKTEYLVIRTKDGFKITQLEGDQAGRETNFRYEKESKTWLLIHESQEVKLVQLIENETGEFVKVFKPDGTTVLVDANLRNRTEIMNEIGTPELMVSAR